MPISTKPYRQKAFATVKGRRMAYIEADTGNAIVSDEVFGTHSTFGVILTDDVVVENLAYLLRGRNTVARLHRRKLVFLADDVHA